MANTSVVRIAIAPDCFTGTLTAVAAARAIAEGWRSVSAGDDLDLLPMTDGGPGFAAAMCTALDGVASVTVVTGPVGEPVEATYTVHAGTAYIESAEACGLHLVPARRRDPGATTSAGVGELLRHAIAAGCTRVVLGVGGTGTCDGGAGLLGRLGAVASDGAGRPVDLSAGADALEGIAAVDLAPAREAVSGIDLVVATDVDSPLLGPRGAAHGFAPQKGASPKRVEQIEGLMTTWARGVGRLDDGGRALPMDPAVMLGAGAGGGIGFAVLALGGGRTSGIDTVLGVTGAADRIAQADLVITGEGALDWQSLRGKVVSGVAGLALAQARPAVALVGRCEVGRREWSGIGLSAVYSTTDEAGSSAEALADPARWLTATAARAARSWSRPFGASGQGV